MRARATSVPPAGPPGVGERLGAGPGRDPARALGPAGRRRRRGDRFAPWGRDGPPAAGPGPSLRLRARSGPPRAAPAALRKVCECESLARSGADSPDPPEGTPGPPPGALAARVAWCAPAAGHGEPLPEAETMAARPPPAPPARALLLGLAAALLAPRAAARGLAVGRTVAPAAPAGTEDGASAYEVVRAALWDGDSWHPLPSASGKDHPEVLTVRIQGQSEELIVNLERNEGLLARGFTETHYLPDGTEVSLARNHTGHCYYHGHVRGHPGSTASLSACAGLRGLITFANRSYVLEPMDGVTDRHKLLAAEALGGAWGACGSGPSAVGPTAGGGHPPPSRTRRKRETPPMTKYVELVIVADNREFQRQGKDLEKVKQRLIEIANHVDKFYRPLNIRVVLVGVEVWNDIDKCPVSQDPFASLHEFLDWRKEKLLPRKSHDNAQLVSGVYFQGTTIGMAPIMSMCTAEQSGGIVMDHSDSPLGAAVTLAHELGHNFGMNHDTQERGCSCRTAPGKGGCIMNPSTGLPFPAVFSSCSRQDLEASLQKGVGMCLFNLPEVRPAFRGRRCGDGYVEDGEECDCGEPEECTNHCCNASTCTLTPGAVCAHGLCCEHCQLKPAGTACRGASHACDLPEFCSGAGPHCPANVYLHDGHPCHGLDGYCYNGVCQTHEQQCVTLWGAGAKPAPGICFERVNSAGDPYGNCGKDAKSSFAKCETRDAKCGKIQCQGGASRPVIGTNAVSIETNIPLQEGGRILCRGTHVYLGDDMPDPGLVLAGTKCADGKICLNRRCQNISVFGVHECARQCHGRGVCNNRKNCHCEAHWAPPFCDRSGFGGSTDSGPVRQAGHRGLAAGVLASVLSLLAAGLAVYLKRKTLVRLLFTDQKTLEKLRCVRPARPPGGCQPGQAPLAPLSKGGLRKPAPSSSATDNPKRPPQAQNVAISRPLQAPDRPRPPSPQRVLPTLHQAPRTPSVPARPLPATPALRQAQAAGKPSAPQKPLPAVPLSRTARPAHAPARAPGPELGLRLAPLRPAPKRPPPETRPAHTAPSQ
ncbi:disintegrin and metalloproteinase domain-containing protein 12 isoform X2 [Pipistrellus kuhlii]|nr:disintegrin and metalloproteinase domain-containing protein 12 isoform X2 [Pipistrellus kuhlii]